MFSSATSSQPTTSSKLLWIIAIVAAMILSITTWIMFFAPTDDIKRILLEERTVNASILPNADKRAWDRVYYDSGNYIQGLTQTLSDYANSAKKGTVTDNSLEKRVSEKWGEAEEGYMALGVLYDYRINFVLQLSSLITIIFVAVLLDAAVVRKKNLYRNSFTSPGRHVLGGKVIGIPSGVGLVLMIFAPFAIPIYWFAAILMFKAAGWWLWVVNLPKRL